MFRDASWVRRAGIAVALIFSLLSGAVSVAHIDGGDDPACAVVLAVAHDASAHSIRPAAASTDDVSDHCFLCHSFRSCYPSFEQFHHRDTAPHGERLHAAQIDRPELVAWTLVPGRAPPA
jgi:hypothetical protein